MDDIIDSERKVLDIAKFIINICTRMGCPISNLKLQLLLYYTQAYSLTKLNKKMFNETIMSGKFGPYIPCVHDAFIYYAGTRISRYFDIDINYDEKIIIIEVINDYIKFENWDLVHKVREEGPWKYVNEIYGLETVIPCDIIKKYFLSL